MAASPVRAVITGGPGAGKSTLLDALADRGLPVFPEVARAILQNPGGMAMRRERPIDFALAMLEAELQAWHAAVQSVAIYDRGFPDIAGFIGLEGLALPAKVDAACRCLRYSGPVFHATSWRAIYTTDAQRIQSWDQAVESDAAVVSAWKRYDYDLVILPNVCVAERADFVVEHIAAKLDCAG